MLPLALRPHRVLLAAVLVGNAVAFAGIDPLARLLTAAAAVALAWSLEGPPPVPHLHRLALAGVGLLAILQLVPLPLALRRLLAPGLGDVLPGGWRPLSLAPWQTIEVVATTVVAVVLALAAARMAGSRSGLPQLLTTLAATGVVLALLGLASEPGLPSKVLLVRANTGGGSPYGPYVNHNHFALGIELTLPATLVLLAAGARHLSHPGGARRRGVVTVLAAGTAAAVGLAALLRCGSRGGVLALTAGALLTAPLWWRRGRGPHWAWLVAGTAVLTAALALAWSRVPALREGFTQLLVVEGTEGVEGNTRWDIWRGTMHLAARSPLLGSGLGSFPHVAGLDKPATGAEVLVQAHNDWLEWLADGGALGAAILLLGGAGMVRLLSPRRVRRTRFEYRYALAGSAMALTAAALHELIGFGLQTPVNWLLCATWVGLVWGVTATLNGHGPAAETTGARPEEIP